jgi:hypothetical protein
MLTPVDFICGGYFLTKPGPGSAVTLSPEQVHFFPDSWAIAWTRQSDATRAESAAALGIPGSALPAVIQQVTDAFEDLFFWPNVIPSVSHARRLLEMVPHSNDWLIVGFGVSEEDSRSLLASNAPLPRQPGFAPTGSGGIFDVLAKRQPLEAGFLELGFDVLEISHGLLWHTSLDFDLRGTKAYDGALNVDGLLPSYPAAQRAARVLTSSLGRGNPSTVTPALIVRYCIQNGQEEGR